MLHGYNLLFATAAAGLIAGADAHTFTAAAAAAAVSVWVQRASRTQARSLYANLDPVNPDGTLLLGALREALNLISRTGQPVRLRLATFTRQPRPAFQLNLTREADLELSGGIRRSALKQPGVWLADHPLPLTLPQDRSVTLLLEPRAPGRIRASLDSACQRPWHGTLPLLLAASACALDIDWLLAAALGFAFQSRLPEDQSECACGNPKVQRP